MSGAPTRGEEPAEKAPSDASERAPVSEPLRKPEETRVPIEEPSPGPPMVDPEPKKLPRIDPDPDQLPAEEPPLTPRERKGA